MTTSFNPQARQKQEKTKTRLLRKNAEKINGTHLYVYNEVPLKRVILTGWFQNEPPCDDVLHILTISKISEIHRKWSFFVSKKFQKMKIFKIFDIFSNKSKINYLNIRTGSKTSGRILNRKRSFYNRIIFKEIVMRSKNLNFEFNFRFFFTFSKKIPY